uniref:Uncharacterized protein n=1 Tax=Brassica campestris TaxID=3711 RepID=A0A3P6A9N1_BRACM|nr:unnamed protein product [Brassica rapa]
MISTLSSTSREILLLLSSPNPTHGHVYPVVSLKRHRSLSNRKIFSTIAKVSPNEKSNLS